jgi:hypothetical protein
MMKSQKQINALFDANREIEKTNPPGNPDADWPAYLLTILTALVLEQREGVRPPIQRAAMIEIIAGACAGMLERFTFDNLPPDQILLVRDAMVSLDALAPSRPRVRMSAAA